MALEHSRGNLGLGWFRKHGSRLVLFVCERAGQLCLGADDSVIEEEGSKFRGKSAMGQ